MKEYPIGGVPVNFPFKPYKSQLVMMSKIITALRKRQSALLESPTGSGKTLALLCAAIAWQRAEYERVEKDLIIMRDKQVARRSFISSENTKLGHTSPVRCDGANCIDDDFRQPTFKKQSAETPQPEDFMNREEQKQQLYLSDPKIFNNTLHLLKKRVPKIYFGSRTHKQLIQVIGELKKTDYCSHIRMTILGSREQSCINEYVLKHSDKNEACKQLLGREQGVHCPYYLQLKKFQNPHQLRRVISDIQKANEAEVVNIWDIEEIARIGKRQNFCPYFATTSLLISDANVIFCPYNYLIDPIIRRTMKLNLDNQIVIFDEAHNIEDTCRDACSFSITENDLVKERDNFEALSKHAIGADSEQFSTACVALAEVCSRILQFMSHYTSDGTKLDGSSGNYHKLWSSGEIIAHFKDSFGIDVESSKTYLKYINDISSIGQESGKNDKIWMSDTKLKILAVSMEKLFTFAEFLFREEYKFMNDFKMGLTVENIVDRGDHQHTGLKKHVVTLKIWCLNPAVAFSDVGPKAWSVILTSGTLSPLDTFASELGNAFPLRHEADHVLPCDRMLVRSVGVGPHGKNLRATHGNMYALDFMDEIGDLLLKVCEAVPFGILCFVPSYRFLDAVAERWQQTSLWTRLSVFKRIEIEPRYSNQLSDSLNAYYNSILNPMEHGLNCTGGLYMAVFRGKVSEGIDFSDDHARIVITVGIPYPNYKDLPVQMKREYNDSRKELLNGSQWYEIQAYRALNQALGRCLRHQNDWGVLLLVDERFGETSKRSKLSKWIRQNLLHRDANQFDQLIVELGEFVGRLLADETGCENKDTTSSSESPFDENNESGKLSRQDSNRTDSTILLEPEDDTSSPKTSVMRTSNENSLARFRFRKFKDNVVRERDDDRCSVISPTKLLDPSFLDASKSMQYAQHSPLKSTSYTKRGRFAIFNDSPPHSSRFDHSFDRRTSIPVENSFWTSSRKTNNGNVIDSPQNLDVTAISNTSSDSPIFLGQFGAPRSRIVQSPETPPVQRNIFGVKRRSCDDNALPLVILYYYLR